MKATPPASSAALTLLDRLDEDVDLALLDTDDDLTANAGESGQFLLTQSQQRPTGPKSGHDLRRKIHALMDGTICRIVNNYRKDS